MKCTVFARVPASTPGSDLKNPSPLIPPPRQEGAEVSRVVCADGPWRAALARPRLIGYVLAVSLGLVIAGADPARAHAPIHPARIFVLMVWDGLRPDFVT